jgi:SAM-dependent methyltransferase
MDIREATARFYDLNPHAPNDVPFYAARLPGPGVRVLELGCGTGRVLVPLAGHCGFIHGVDASDAMLRVCRDKVARAGLDAARVRLSRADIVDLDLGDRFDLIIAPFRVIQNLETDAQLRGLFRGIRSHLTPAGRCILNAFNPNRPREALRRDWVSDREHLAWETATPDGRVACYDVRARMDAERLILYPRLVYRRFVGERVAEEAALEIAMRCHFPDDFLGRIEEAGFLVTGTWGGYAGEGYGRGPELVVEFRLAGAGSAPV